MKNLYPPPRTFVWAGRGISCYLRAFPQAILCKEYIMEKKTKQKLALAKAYASPTMQILLITEADVIKTSLEIGGEWPWGEAQTSNFG